MPELGAVYLFNHSSCSHQSLEAVTEKMAIIHSSMYIVLFSLVLSLAVTHCHLYCHFLSLVVIGCHMLSLADICCTTHCYFCHSLLFVVTRCITSLSFYKRMIQSIKLARAYSLKIGVHKFQKCKRENV